MPNDQEPVSHDVWLRRIKAQFAARVAVPEGAVVVSISPVSDMEVTGDDVVFRGGGPPSSHDELAAYRTWLQEMPPMLLRQRAFCH